MKASLVAGRLAVVLGAVGVPACFSFVDGDSLDFGGASGSYIGNWGTQAGSGGQTYVAPEPPVPDACVTEPACASFRTPAGQGVPPTPPASGGEAEGSENVQAVARLYLGDTRRDGTHDPDAWRQLGFDLDGWSSTPAQGFHCVPPVGGNHNRTREDGEGGIDNSFGRNLASLLDLLDSADATSVTSEGIKSGSSLLIDIDALGSASGYTALPGAWSLSLGAEKASGGLQAPPDGTWTGYAWRPIEGSVTPWGDAYLTENRLVARFAQPLPLMIPGPGGGLRLTVHGARLQVDLSDRQRGVMGTLGGIVPTETMMVAFRQRLATISTATCGDSSVVQGLEKNIRQASDILLDGTQDPERECDGISLGLGFETRASLKGPSVTPPAVSDPCAGP